MNTPPAKPPEILDKIVDVVLAHRPKPKTRAAKKKKKRQSECHDLSPQNQRLPSDITKSTPLNPITYAAMPSNCE